jgi:hypothetical protein
MGCAVKFKIPAIDARTRTGRRVPRRIVDEDTGKTVGFMSGGYGSGRDNIPRYVIRMFGGKYGAGFKSWEECSAFAKGVEAVLSHITSVGKDEESTDVHYAT